MLTMPRSTPRKSSTSVGGTSAASIERGVQVQRAIAQDEVGLTAQTIAARLLVPTEAARHQVSAVERQQADVLRALPRHEALVVGQCSVRAKRRLDGCVALIRLDHLGDRAYRHLR